MPRATKTKTKALPPKRTRNDGRKGRTRQRLIDATIEIVSSEGAGALTTGRIASGAGIQQPGFYAHFKNVDECLEATAKQITAYMIDTERLMRAKLVVLDNAQLGDTTARMRAALQLWVDNRRIAELAIRCRYDASPLGESCRAGNKRAAEWLFEDLWDLAIRLGLRARYLKDIQLMAAVLVSNFAGALDLIFSGMFKDLDAVAAALARSQHHYVDGELRRMLKEQSQS